MAYTRRPIPEWAGTAWRDQQARRDHEERPGRAAPVARRVQLERTERRATEANPVPLALQVPEGLPGRRAWRGRRARLVRLAGRAWRGRRVRQGRLVPMAILISSTTSPGTPSTTKQRRWPSLPLIKGTGG